MLPDDCCIIFTLCAMNLTRQTPLTARIIVITIKKHVVKAMTRPWRLRTTTILFGISAFFLLASGVYINNRPVFFTVTFTPCHSLLYFQAANENGSTLFKLDNHIRNSN